MKRILLFLCFFLPPAVSQASITLVGYTGAGSTDTNNVTAPNSGSVATTNCTTVSCDTTGANLIRVTVHWYSGGSECTLSDNKSNTYTSIRNNTAIVNSSTHSYYALNPTVGSGHTWSCGSGSGDYPSITVSFFSGVATSSALDQQNGTATTTTASLQPGSITPSQGNELVVADCAAYDGGTATGSFNLSMTNLAEVPVSAGAHMGGNMAYIVQGSATAINPTCTQTNASILGMATGIDSWKSAAASGTLSFTTQPVNTHISGVTTMSSIVVTSTDNTFTGNVTLAFVSACGPALGGTTTVSASSGVATFNAVTLTGASNSACQFAASATGYTTVNSGNFWAGPNQLVFTTQPSSGYTSGTAVTAITTSQFGDNTTDNGATGTVTLSFLNCPAISFGGTTSQSQTTGVASWSNTPTGGGSNCKEHVTDGTLAATSTAFYVQPTLTYQWYKGMSGDTSMPISMATMTSYTTPGLTMTTDYWVRIEDSSSNTADSNTAVITVTGGTAPSITVQPMPQTITSGSMASLSVTATGTPTLAYQWYQGSSCTGSMVGTNSSSYTTPALTMTTTYSVNVSNAFGNVCSSDAVITVSSSSHLSSISPSTGTQGATVPITLAGTSLSCTVVTLQVSGSGITVSSPTCVDSTHITATLTIASNATISVRTVGATLDGTPVGNTVNFSVLSPVPALRFRWNIAGCRILPSCSLGRR